MFQGMPEISERTDNDFNPNTESRKASKTSIL